LVCFSIRREFRGQGVTEQLIEATADYAKRNGAIVLEAYPVDPDSPSYRFMGYVPTFEAAGFEEIGRAGTRRHVTRRLLGE
jgi:GNAT superfamily N-acetyltransferase